MNEKKRRIVKRKKKQQRQQGFTDRMRHNQNEPDYANVRSEQYRPCYSNRTYVENLLDMAQDSGDYL